jgi:hypothetical protein
MNYETPKFHGQCVGLDLEPRGANDQHIIITLYVEDDGNWHRKFSVSSSWLPEFIHILQEAQKWCSTQTPHMVNEKQLGWKFK